MKLIINGRGVLQRKVNSISARKRAAILEDQETLLKHLPKSVKEHDVNIVERHAVRELGVDVHKLCTGLPSKAILRTIFPGIKKQADIQRAWDRLSHDERYKVWVEDLSQI